MNQIYIEVYGIKAQIESASKEVIQYIRNNMEDLLKYGVDDYSLDIKISKILRPWEKLNAPSNVPYMGSEIYQDNDIVIYKKKYIRIEAELIDGSVKINVQKKMRWDQYVRSLLRIPGNYSLNILQEIYRFCIEYPIFMMLNNKSGFSVLHASAIINSNDKAVVFMGLNGAGKTTLLERFLNKGYKPLSDNFLLLKKGKIYAFPSLKKVVRTEDYNKNNIVGYAYNKLLIKQKYAINKDGYEIERVNIVSRGGSRSFSIKLQPEKAEWYLRVIGDYLKEYENYHFATFLEKNKHTVLQKNYEDILRKATFYRINVSEEDKLNDSELL